MEFYLKEAFQSLKLLEDDFNLTADQGVIDELQSFVADDIEAPAEEEIIDVEADEVEDLQDNYIGKVILECDSCHTRIYKNIADVIIDEDSGLANVDEECPVCGNAFGWNVLGKIEKFNPDEFEEEEHEDEEEPAEDADEAEETEEISDDEISEALKEALSADEQKELDGIVYNHLADAAYEAEVDHELDAQRSDMEKAQKKFNDDFYFGTVEEDIDVHVDQPEDSDDVAINVDADDELHEEFEDPDKVGVDPDRAVEDDHDLETPMENPVTEIPDKLVVNESKLTEDVWHVRELVYGWLYDHLLDLNDNLAQQLHYEIPEYDVDWCSEDGMSDMSYEVEKDMDEYVDSLINLLFANAPRQESLGEDLENVQSEDAKKLEDPEKDPIKGELEEECDKEESLNEKAIDPALKGQKPKKVDKFEYSMSNDAVKRVADIIYNEMEESDFDLLNDIGFNAYIDKDPEAIKQVKELFKKYGLPMWALKVFCEAWDDQNESLNEAFKVGQKFDCKATKYDPELIGTITRIGSTYKSIDGKPGPKTIGVDFTTKDGEHYGGLDLTRAQLDDYISKGEFTPIDESLNEKFSASLAGEHKGSLEDKFGEGCKDEYYGYIGIDHPTLGKFTISVGTDGDVRTDGRPWEFLQEDEYKLTPEQAEFVMKHKNKFAKMAKNDIPNKTFRESFVEVTSYDQAKKLGVGTKWAWSGNYPGHEDEGEELFNKYRGLGKIFIDPEEKLCKILARGKTYTYDKDDNATVDESLNEDLNEVEVHTDEQDIEVKTEDGKVVVEVGNPEPAEAPSEDEMIAPLDAEEITDIENNEEQSAEEVAMEDEVGEEDMPAEDELDVDEFDEESFDEIGESYLHRVYENVNSFKTTSVKKGSNKLVIEGLIRFNSGKEKKTSFVFENARTTKRGKLMLEGKNETFSRSSKAFLLKGVLANKKFIAESMTYNYTAKTINESNESELTRVYGRAVRK